MVLVYRDVNVSDPESGVARTLPALTICGDPASKLLDPRIYELVAAGLALQWHCGVCEMTARCCLRSSGRR
jgi:hypothetical protein